MSIKMQIVILDKKEKAYLYAVTRNSFKYN